MLSILIKGGVLILGVVLYTSLYVAGTMHSVLIKGGVLISGVLSYISLLYVYIAETMHSVLIKIVLRE